MEKDFELMKLTSDYQANLRELQDLPLKTEERKEALEELTRDFVEGVAEVLHVPELDDDSAEEEEQSWIEEL